MKKLKTGVIGLGVGEQHVKAYLRNPHCTVRRVCDLSEEKLAEAQKNFFGIPVTKHSRDVISDPDIDLISVASYDDAHFNQTLEALAEQKHVFVEKPLCQSLDQARKIKHAWKTQKGSRYLGCNLVLREAPLYKWLREEIRRGTFGSLFGFDGEYLYGRLNKITDGWRKDVPGYSVMEGGGIHMIDLMLWLTGQRPLSVFSAGNRICSEGTAFQYEDFVTSIMQFDSGMIGRITANFGCVHRHQHVVRIYGTKATFLSDDAGPRMYHRRDPEDPAQVIDLSPLPKTKGDLIPGFVSAILTKKDITDETQMIFDGISICSASDRALQKHKQETIHYI